MAFSLKKRRFQGDLIASFWYLKKKKMKNNFLFSQIIIG